MRQSAHEKTDRPTQTIKIQRRRPVLKVFRSFGGKMEPLGETHEDRRATAQALNAPDEP